MGCPKKMMSDALRKDAQRKLAAKAERLVVNGYPIFTRPTPTQTEGH